MSAALGLAASLLAASLLAAAATPPATVAPAPPPGRVTGVGGVFFKSRDPRALALWYRDVLGVPFEPWGGALLRYDAPQHPPMLVFTPFSAGTRHFEPSQREFMLNFAVDDLDAVLARVAAKGVAIEKRDDSDPSGRFAWILDPEGLKIELWEPKRP